MNTVTAALPLRNLVVFPGMISAVTVGRATSVAAIDAHLEGAPLVLAAQRDPDEEDPERAELANVVCSGQVLRSARLPDGTARLLIEGVERLERRSGLVVQEGLTACEVAPMPELHEDPAQVGGLAKQLVQLFEEFALNTGLGPQEVQLLVGDADQPERLADQIAGKMELTLEERIAVLEEPSLRGRLEMLVNHMVVALSSQKVATEVGTRLQAAMDQSQREYHLREQLKVIRAELGEQVGAEADADAFEKRLKEAGLPDDGLEEALREVDRLRRIHPDSAEYTIIRTWLETVCDVPWSHATTDATDLVHAQQVLDEDHFGLEKVKERILEYLAVRQLRPDSKGALLCFVGPPGVGKTSLGRSIARALGREFGRIALGGIKDEPEIRGHRRTYVGALPGRILRAVIRAGSRNPVLVLDEIDKIGADFRGDPASALLEVLDPEQNTAFVDHYLDLSVDLSQVLFIATANLMDPIPPPLLDRLEILELPGYAEEDKVAIGRRFLLPKLAERHGLAEGTLSMNDDALQRIIRDYTREPGLRELERQIATVHRKVARKVVEGRTKPVRVGPRSLPRYLGPPKYHRELSERVDQPGVATGLAWTATGGEILFIEAIRMPGKHALKLTGSLGSVMKESAEAAMSWLRAHSVDYGLTAETFEAEFHLHVPAGAIPKDGPSAGVTMATALASLATGRAARSHLAMTGEITLRGRVLPVGGIKEKVLAARRSGVRTVIIPRHNENDLAEIPGVMRRNLSFILVDTVADVLNQALVSA